MSRPPLLALLPLPALALLTACAHEPRLRSKGAATPTLAGEAPAPFADALAARAAFTRADGPMTAVLDDAAWIRLEPDPANAERRHPDYFRGWTTFEVELRTHAFVQPTAETYLLEDSTGARVTTRPASYKGDTARELGPRHVARFTLVFPHVMSKEARWLRLSREGPEGGVVTWDLTRAP